MNFIKLDSTEINSGIADKIALFLFKNLDQYGDPLWQIEKCISYAQNPEKGGSIFYAVNQNNEIKGAVVTNKTGMDGYIPSNILVYIAVDPDQRGKGIGDKLIKLVKKHLTGGIALHVEPDNPAKKLYERNGFSNKYLEMRAQ